jgi:putative hydrolase of the HAD superfamily
MHLPGSKEALEMVKNMGIRMAVITNGGSEVQREKLERFGITHYFNKIIIERKLGLVSQIKKYFYIL